MDNNNNNQQSFWQFSDQLRLHSSNLANLSLNDSIWSVNSYAAKNSDARRNFDPTVGGDTLADKGSFVNNNMKMKMKMNMKMNVSITPPSSVNNDSWKLGPGINLNGGFNKGVYSKGVNNNFNSINNYNNNNNNNMNCGLKGYKKESFMKREEEDGMNLGGKHGKKNKEVKKDNYNNNNDNSNSNSNGVDKRFKTLPPSESLARNETVGGYIFVCNNDTMEENLKRQLFGLPPRYRDSVRQITPGLPLFLYNYSTHQLHGIYEASSFGGTNIDPMAWEDKKNPGESRFPAQVRVHTRKLCEPLDEDAFRPILHHYDGPKFRLELSVPEALSLLDIFDDSDA